MELSKRHHYIPEFLIKGFVGKDGKVSVYDIKNKRLQSRRKSPKQVFFEWNRNTFEVHGEKTDFVEGLYQFGENQFAPVYQNIVKQKGPVDIAEKDIFHLIYFIGSLYWRVPSNDEKSAKIIKNSTNQDLLFRIQKEDGEEASQELYDRIMNEPAFVESSKIILAIRDFLKTDIVSNFENWKLYYADGDVELHVLGDNPVIRRNSESANPYESELIFRLSKGKTVYYTNGKKIKRLSPEHAVSVDVLIFLQSEKMVCGPNGDYLNHIALLADQYRSEDKMTALKNEIFNVFD